MVKVFVDGMMCGHCAKRVEAALAALGCVARVDLQQKCALIEDAAAPSDDALKRAIADAGYMLRAIERK